MTTQATTVKAYIALVKQIKEGVPVDERPDAQCKDYPGQNLQQILSSLVSLHFFEIIFIIIIIDIEA